LSIHLRLGLLSDIRIQILRRQGFGAIQNKKAWQSVRRLKRARNCKEIGKISGRNFFSIQPQETETKIEQEGEGTREKE
jgi:hypothetical protein